MEDKQAKLLIEQMLAMYVSECLPDENYRPLFKVAPVGGFVQVVEMLNSSSAVFPNHVKRFAFLDEDVKAESLVEAHRKNNKGLLSLFDAANGKIHYLPCTPEVGVVEMFELDAQSDRNLLTKLNQMFYGHQIFNERTIREPQYLLLNKANPRDKAKDRLKYIVEKIIQTTGFDDLYVRRSIYFEYVKFKYADDVSSLKRIFGPVFNSH